MRRTYVDDTCRWARGVYYVAMNRLTALTVLRLGALSLPVAWVACGSDDPATAPVDAGADVADAAPFDASPPVDAADAADAAPPVDLAIYVHSATTLYRFDPDARSLDAVGVFSCAADRVFNIAVNVSGEIYGVTSQGLVRIDPKTAFCAPVAKGVYPQALTFVPKGMLDADREVLVGYSFAQYVRIDESSGVITALGALNPNPTQGQFLVSGDVVAGIGGHLFLTSLEGPAGDVLVEADPVTGKVIKRLGPNLPSVAMLGLAQWKGFGYAFSASGKIYKLSLKTGAASLVTLGADGGLPDGGGDGGIIAFAGAGVTTLAPLQ